MSSFVLGTHVAKRACKDIFRGRSGGQEPDFLYGVGGLGDLEGFSKCGVQDYFNDRPLVPPNFETGELQMTKLRGGVSKLYMYDTALVDLS